MSWQQARPDRDVRHGAEIRSTLYAPTSKECRAAARTLRRVASIRAEGGRLRALYLEVAELCEHEADAIQRVTGGGGMG